MKDLKSQLETIKKSDSEAKRALAEQEEQIQAQKDALAAQGIERENSELATLRAALEGKEKELEGYRSKTEQDVDELKASIAELSVYREVAERESLRIKKEQELAPLRENDVAQLRQALEKKDSEVVMLREKSESDLKHLVNTHEKTLSIALAAKEAELLEAKENAKKEQEQLNEEISRLNGQYDPEEISGLRSALARSLERERELVASQRNASEKGEGKDKEVEELKSKLDEALAQVADILYFI